MKKAEQNKLNINNDKILMLLIGILIITTTILAVVMIKRTFELDTNSAEIVELHNYFSSNDLQECEGLFNYSDRLVEYKDISSQNKLCIAYQKANIKDVETATIKVDKKKNICTLEKGIVFKANENSTECVYSKVKKEIIDNSYKKLYGRDIEDNKSFKIDNLNICYLKDDYYYCGLAETFTYTIGSESFIYRVIEKAVEKSSDIIIYDYFVKINDDTCFQNYTTTTINEECTNNFNVKKDITFNFMKKYAAKYKHVYRKNEDGTYHWVSSEPVKIEE